MIYTDNCNSDPTQNIFTIVSTLEPLENILFMGTNNTVFLQPPQVYRTKREQLRWGVFGTNEQVLSLLSNVFYNQISNVR